MVNKTPTIPVSANSCKYELCGCVEQNWFEFWLTYLSHKTLNCLGPAPIYLLSLYILIDAIAKDWWLSEKNVGMLVSSLFGLIWFNV